MQVPTIILRGIPAGYDPKLYAAIVSQNQCLQLALSVSGDVATDPTAEWLDSLTDSFRELVLECNAGKLQAYPHLLLSVEGTALADLVGFGESDAVSRILQEHGELFDGIQLSFTEDLLPIDLEKFFKAISSYGLPPLFVLTPGNDHLFDLANDIEGLKDFTIPVFYLLEHNTMSADPFGIPQPVMNKPNGYTFELAANPPMQIVNRLRDLEERFYEAGTEPVLVQLIMNPDTSLAEFAAIHLGDYMSAAKRYLVPPVLSTEVTS